MVRVVIPREVKVATSREVDINSGELIMLVSDRNISETGELSSAAICVFDNVVFGERRGGRRRKNRIKGPFIDVRNVFYLYPSKQLGGIGLPIIKSYRLEHQYKLSWIKDLYVGRDQIVEKLRSSPGFEPHADLISRTEKPYLRD